MGKCYQRDFRTRADTGGKDSLTKSDVHVEHLPAIGIQPTILFEKVSAWTPAEQRELNGVRMAGQCQWNVPALHFKVPVRRVMTQQYTETRF